VGSYTLFENFLKEGGLNSQIILLSEDSLILRRVAKFAPAYEGQIGCDQEIQYTYIH
jgi:hypothetical protein